MQHPLEAVPTAYRLRFFLACLLLTVILFSVFRALDRPLRTSVSPQGIVSFEFARTPENAQMMIDFWTGRMVVKVYTDGVNSNALVAPAGESFEYNPIPVLHAAFGLGLDYLFMPAYSLALAFATLLAMQRHAGWVKSLGALAGYAAFIAALFDAVENFALWQILLGAYQSVYPALAAFCASVKFGLLIFGLLVALFGWLWPGKQRSIG